MAKKLRIGEMLVTGGILTREQLNEALNAQLIYGGKLGTNLVEHGFITEEFLTSFLSKQFNIPAVEAKELEDVPSSVIEVVPKELADKHKVIPFRKDKRRLDVALLDPMNVKAIDELAFKTGLLIRPYIAPEVTIARCLERYYQVAGQRRYIRIGNEREGSLEISRELATPIEMADENEASSGNGEPSGSFAAPVGLPSTGSAVGIPDAFPDRPMTLSQVVYDLQSVENSTQIVDRVMRFSRPYFKKRGIFVLRADEFEQVVAEGPEGFAKQTQKLRIPIKEPNIFHSVFTSKRYHLGTLPANPENFRILEQLKEELSSPVFILPLIYNQRAELVLFAANFTPSFTMDHIRSFQLLMEKAGLAHQILLLKSRLALLPDDVH
jgi:hypothetical protein